MAATRRLRTGLDQTLFAEAPPPPALTARRALIAAAVAVAAVALLLLRIDRSDPLDSFWAEDGRVLFQTAVTEGTPSALGSLWFGYLLLVPRLIAEAASIFPLTFAPEVFAVLAACVAVASGFVVWRASAGHIRSPELRAGLAILVPFNPVSGLEALGSAAYVSWHMLFAAFWVLLWRPASVARAFGGSAFGFATAATTPLAGALAPVALLRGIAIRDRRDALIAGGFALGFVLQAATVALNRGSNPRQVGPDLVVAAPNAHWDGAVWKEYVQRVLGGSVFGLDLGGDIWVAASWAFLGAALLAALTLAVLAVRNDSARARWLTIVCVATSVWMFLASSYARDFGGDLAWPSGSYHEYGARYAMVPTLLLVSALFVQLDSRAPRLSMGRWSMAKLAALALVTIAIVTSFDQSDDAARGTPRWSDAVAKARRSCEDESRRIAGIPISPPGWSVNLPCAELK